MCLLGCLYCFVGFFVWFGSVRFFFPPPNIFFPLAPWWNIDRLPQISEQKLHFLKFKTKIIPSPVASNQHGGGTPPLLGRQKVAEMPL